MLGGGFSCLVNFSDCEGFFMGPTCKILADDFESFSARTLGFGPDFLDDFNRFKVGFRIASDTSGAVVFG